jgi:hypothetical protein
MLAGRNKDDNKYVNSQFKKTQLILCPLISAEPLAPAIN